jgi:XTP/dITP diphosphohydrolase
VKLLFASQNQHKTKEISKILPSTIELVSLKDLNFNEDIPENHDTIEENALEKARVIFDTFKLPCFADDTGLFIEALNGEPGVYSARWAQLDNSFENNIEKALFKLKDKSNRKAYFKTVVAYKDASEEKLFEGVIHGKITESEKGEGGFGYDPIFVPDGYKITFSEMPLEEKNKISHRALAMAKFIYYLKEK